MNDDNGNTAGDVCSRRSFEPKTTMTDFVLCETSDTSKKVKVRQRHGGKGASAEHPVHAGKNEVTGEGLGLAPAVPPFGRYG